VRVKKEEEKKIAIMSGEVSRMYQAEKRKRGKQGEIPQIDILTIVYRVLDNNGIPRGEQRNIMVSKLCSRLGTSGGNKSFVSQAQLKLFT
jgi:hypothetical protein